MAVRKRREGRVFIGVFVICVLLMSIASSVCCMAFRVRRKVSVKKENTQYRKGYDEAWLKGVFMNHDLWDDSYIFGEEFLVDTLKEGGVDELEIDKEHKIIRGKYRNTHSFIYRRGEKELKYAILKMKKVN